MGTEYRMSPDYEASKKERLDYSSEASKTGFMWRKYFDENPINDLNSYSAVTPVIRYAEVLLSYLECLIESGQAIDQTVLNLTINQVRGRADVKMPPLQKLIQTNCANYSVMSVVLNWLLKVSDIGTYCAGNLLKQCLLVRYGVLLILNLPLMLVLPSL